MTGSSYSNVSESHFWSKVDKSAGPDACWPWMASRNENGYGHFWYKGRCVGAHRVAYILARGPIPRRDGHHGACVCHACDTPACCNPAHLWIGTQADNVADREAKGRRSGPAGELNGRAKLSIADILDIRKRLAGGQTQSSVAQLYGVCQAQISRIARREQWAMADAPKAVR